MVCLTVHPNVIFLITSRYMSDWDGDSSDCLHVSGWIAYFVCTSAVSRRLIDKSMRTQEVFHVHVHIIPRFQNDKLVKYKPTKSRIADDVGRGQVETIQRYLRQADLHLDTAEAENALGTQGLSDT